MRIIVISDTHGKKSAIDSVFLRNSDADLSFTSVTVKEILTHFSLKIRPTHHG